MVKVELIQQVREDWEVGLKSKLGWYEDEFSDPTLDQDDEFYSATVILKRYF